MRKEKSIFKVCVHSLIQSLALCTLRQNRRKFWGRGKEKRPPSLGKISHRDVCLPTEVSSEDVKSNKLARPGDTHL